MRKRSESESSSSDDTTLKTQVRRLTEKLKDMEASRKWNSASNEKQYLHQVKIRQLCVEDFRDALEEQFGYKKKIPPKLVAVVKKGEKEINNRIKILKMADRVSWGAVDRYQADPLCDGDEDDKRWKQAVKEDKEERYKRKGYSSRRDNRRSSPGRYGDRDRDRRSYGGRPGGNSGRTSYRYNNGGRDGGADDCLGERIVRATTVGRPDTLGRIAGLN